MSRRRSGCQKASAAPSVVRFRWFERSWKNGARWNALEELWPEVQRTVESNTGCRPNFLDSAEAAPGTSQQGGTFCDRRSARITNCAPVCP
jgi:hypothetical protein